MADDGPSIADWISVGASLTATFVGIVTLLTVYIGAMQLLTQSRAYRASLSWRSLGPWQSTVATSSLFGLQRRITTPTVSPQILLKRGWSPELTLPSGFPRGAFAEEGDNVQARTTWVNFMQSLGLTPTRRSLYEIQDASELINGVVPMHWTGQNLVSVCSVLGFQSHEDSPSYNSPMPLPMQWSSPIGWLQLRPSSNGCIAEFRRRMDQVDQIPRHLYMAFQAAPLPRGTRFLRSRLWNSISGLVLRDERALYLGSEGNDSPGGDDEAAGIPLFEHLISKDLPQQDVLRKLFGNKDSHPEALRRQTGVNMTRRPPKKDEPPTGQTDDSKTVYVFKKSPGLLSVAVEGELAYNRGLRIDATCEEYDRVSMDLRDVDRAVYPYKICCFHMDLPFLTLFKEALWLLQPDGYFFTSNPSLHSDLLEVYRPFGAHFSKQKQIFPAFEMPVRGLEKSDDSIVELLSISQLCNCFPILRQRHLSVNDMGILARAAEAARSRLVSGRRGAVGSPEDLMWSILYCPRICHDLLDALGAGSTNPSLSTFLSSRVTARSGTLDFSSLLTRRGEQDAKDEKGKLAGRYVVPLLADGDFTGKEVLAALLSVLVRWFWIDAVWITDVAAYDFTMPQNVLML